VTGKGGEVTGEQERHGGFSAESTARTLVKA